MALGVGRYCCMVRPDAAVLATAEVWMNSGLIFELPNAVKSNHHDHPTDRRPHVRFSCSKDYR
jgi:hypothetical protein